ncbi:MAG: hypothetical protein RIC03_16195 [Cyclobacteriaceae bacterium]
MYTYKGIVLNENKASKKEQLEKERFWVGDLQNQGWNSSKYQEI